jgi:hypothetical protein
MSRPADTGHPATTDVVPRYGRGFVDRPQALAMTFDLSAMMIDLKQ